MKPSDSLTSLDDALEHILGRATPLSQRRDADLFQARGSVLARDIPVPVDVPPADNSAVDGYAVRIADLGAPLPLTQRITAGDQPGPLEPGTAARIFTGASVPAGADAVIMQEDVVAAGDHITTRKSSNTGENIRSKGQDLKSGDRALPAGTRLRPQELGLLASLGIATVPVWQAPRIAILTTGNELVTPGQPLPAGKIYNTNRYMLHGFLQALGCQPIAANPVADTRDATITALKHAADGVDLVITCGGVSVGEEDHVRGALETLGKLSLWRLALKPGKPLAFGHIGATPVMGLPGNPAAVLVTFMMVVAPFVRQMQGQQKALPQPLWLPADFAVERSSIRREFVRARLHNSDGQSGVQRHPNQSSGMLSSACWADGLAMVPENQTLARGDSVMFYPFSELLR